MPVKWSSDKDAFILNALLLHPDIKINNPVIDTMISSWPEAFGEKPTRKAITEHFSKIRKANKEFVPGPGPTTPAATPRKAKSGNNGVKKTPASKRKRTIKNNNSESDDIDDDEGGTNVTPREKQELGEAGGLEEEESPSKRARREGVKVKYEESDGDQHPSDLDAEDEYKQVLEV